MLKSPQKLNAGLTAVSFIDWLDGWRAIIFRRHKWDRWMQPLLQASDMADQPLRSAILVRHRNVDESLLDGNAAEAALPSAVFRACVRIGNG